LTFFPEYITEIMDIGVRGEGFEALPEIADAYENVEDPRDILNVIHHGGINPLRPLMPKDNMLLPDRDIIYKDNKAKPIKSIMASFGCTVITISGKKSTIPRRRRCALFLTLCGRYRS
jgi:radical SAM superfamily enzyme YgiQ (UPF0313 family)